MLFFSAADFVQVPLSLLYFDGGIKGHFLAIVAVVMIFGHFAKEQQYEVLNKIMQSLKPGGVLLLELYEDSQLTYNTGGPRELNYLYNEQMLKSWAKTYEILHFACVEVERKERILHTGVCKALQCVVKK